MNSSRKKVMKGVPLVGVDAVNDGDKQGVGVDAVDDGDKQVTMKEIAIEDLHKAACLSRESTYVDPTSGYSVFTKDFHLKRGTCCGNRCRHCPYDHCNVRGKMSLMK